MPPGAHRAAATAVATLLTAMPVLVAAAAQAAPARDPLPVESGQEVVFSGERRLLRVSCVAYPSTTSVTIPAETTLRVVNRTGYRAKLLLDGAAQGEVVDGATAPVVFHRGPVMLGLKPTCMLSDESPVRVEVVPAPGTEAPVTQPRTRPAGGGSDQPKQREPAVRRPAPRNPDPAGTEAEPEKVTQTPGPAVIAQNGGDSGDTVDTVDEDIAAEAISSVQPVQDSGSIGLLALIATVCVLVVSGAAIRTIIAQRVTRTRVA
jgi:hypothetical protein